MVTFKKELYEKISGLIEPNFQRLLADLMENYIIIRHADPELFDLNLSKWRHELENDIFLWNLKPDVDHLTIHELIAKFLDEKKIVRHCRGRYYTEIVDQNHAFTFGRNISERADSTLILQS